MADPSSLATLLEHSRLREHRYMLPAARVHVSNNSFRQITGLIIAGSWAQYTRAAKQVRLGGISPTFLPAVVLRDRNYSTCGGGNGLRLAVANAFRLITQLGAGMAVFEEA